MDTRLYLHCLVACIIGNLIHIAFKAYSLSVDYKKANMKFHFSQYLKDDRFALTLDLLGSLGLVYLADEWINNEYILGKIKTAFVVVGFTGSYVIQYFASVAKKRFRQVVDEKTNIADEKTNP